MKGGEVLKNPKKLKRRHKKMLTSFGIDPSQFYVVKELLDKIIFVDKQGNKLEIPTIR